MPVGEMVCTCTTVNERAHCGLYGCSMNLAGQVKHHRQPDHRGCAKCGKDFLAAREDARYCSAKCRKAASRDSIFVTDNAGVEDSTMSQLMGPLARTAQAEESIL